MNKSDTLHKSRKINTIKTEFDTFDDCSVCSKKVSGTETLACSTCKHWVHKRCIGHFNNRTEYQDFLHHFSSELWDCPACTADMLPFTLMDQSEFVMLLLDMYSQPNYINKDNYQQIFRKLSDVDFFNDAHTIESDHTNYKYTDNIDPDINYPNTDSCNYIIDTSLLTIKSSKELTMMNFNIRSLRKNYNNFVNLLSQINCKIHVICLTESWLGPNDNIKDFEIEGYHIPHCQNRIGNMHGGGVITYIHRDIPKYKVVESISFVDEFNHCLVTEIAINNKTTTFLNIYRSPNSTNDLFINQFEKQLRKSNLENATY